MKALTVLVTGGGAPGIAGTVYALRNNPEGIPVRIVAVDMRQNAVGKFLADAFHLVPSADDISFCDRILELIHLEKVDVLLPQVTRELIPLAKSMNRIVDSGARIAISEEESIRKANDKLEVLQAARQIGVPFPAFYATRSEDELREAAYSLGYPKKRVVIKPRVSNGMRGLRVISSNKWDVHRFLNEKPSGLEISLEELVKILKNGTWPELLVTEYLPGPEYTVDVFRGKYIEIAIPRARKQIRSGITFEALIDMRIDLISYSLKLARFFGLKYCFGFQFKMGEDGTPKVIECNPRVQGTMVAAAIAGFNLIYYAVIEALGRPVKPNSLKELKNGSRFLRYWGGICVDEKERFIAKI